MFETPLKKIIFSLFITQRKSVFPDTGDLFANAVFTGSQKAVHISSTRKQAEERIIHNSINKKKL